MNASPQALSSAPPKPTIRHCLTVAAPDKVPVASLVPVTPVLVEPAAIVESAESPIAVLATAPAPCTS